MLVGIPREIKTSERRVALTPDAVRTLCGAGLEVRVEAGAGLGSGFADAEYLDAGARLCPGAEALYREAELIVKVKELQSSEFSLTRPGQLVFGYFHLAASRALTEACLQAKIAGLAFETLEGAGGGLPLLAPMSAIAGRLAVQEGARFLEGPSGGSGVLLGGIPGVPPGKVVILGAGVVGENAARVAAGLGADVLLLDVNYDRLQELARSLPPNVRTLMSSAAVLSRAAAAADLLVGAVLVRGRRAPHLVTREVLRSMRPGSVFVDVCVDQGGSADTTRATTHEAPTYVEEGVIHYCVANMPGAVPRTSTQALSAVILPYVLELAQRGLGSFLRKSSGYAAALNVYQGKIVNDDVAATFPELATAPLAEFF